MLQKKSSVEISAYFSADSETQAFEYRDIVEAWLYTSDCVDLGDCGCFCVQTSPTSRVTPVDGGMIRFNVTFSGFYQPSAVGSLSASESV
jgi:hypothetical protein